MADDNDYGFEMPFLPGQFEADCYHCKQQINDQRGWNHHCGCSIYHVPCFDKIYIAHCNKTNELQAKGYDISNMKVHCGKCQNSVSFCSSQRPERREIDNPYYDKEPDDRRKNFIKINFAAIASRNQRVNFQMDVESQYPRPGVDMVILNYGDARYWIKLFMEEKAKACTPITPEHLLYLAEAQEDPGLVAIRQQELEEYKLKEARKLKGKCKAESEDEDEDEELAFLKRDEGKGVSMESQKIKPIIHQDTQPPPKFVPAKSPFNTPRAAVNNVIGKLGFVKSRDSQESLGTQQKGKGKARFEPVAGSSSRAGGSSDGGSSASQQPGVDVPEKMRGEADWDYMKRLEAWFVANGTP